LEWRCQDTVCLATPSTSPAAWSPLENVRKASIHCYGPSVFNRKTRLTVTNHGFARFFVILTFPYFNFYSNDLTLFSHLFCCSLFVSVHLLGLIVCMLCGRLTSLLVSFWSFHRILNTSAYCSVISPTNKSAEISCDQDMSILNLYSAYSRRASGALIR